MMKVMEDISKFWSDDEKTRAEVTYYCHSKEYTVQVFHECVHRITKHFKSLSAASNFAEDQVRK